MDLSRLAENEYVLISDGVSYLSLCMQDIVSLEVDQNYTRIKVRDREKPLVIRKSLTSCFDRLPLSLFFQSNRKQVINLAHIKKIEPHDPKRFVVEMDDGSSVIFSRIQTVLFRRSMSL